jgi:hypothetical protein
MCVGKLECVEFNRTVCNVYFKGNGTERPVGEWWDYVYPESDCACCVLQDKCVLK